MDIKLGTQLCVLQGYKGLIPDLRYYYLGPWNRHSAGLLFFYREGGYQRVQIVNVQRSEFEALIDPDTNILRCSETQLHRPEWFGAHQHTDFSRLEDSRYRGKKTEHEVRVSDRLAKIAGALAVRNKLLSLPDPLRALHPFAKAAGAHPYRFCADYFAYILHGYDRWALMTRWFNNGTWDREEKGKKFGRPALARNYDFVFPMTRAMRRSIVSFVRRSKRKFETFRDLHDEYIRVVCDVKIIEINGHKRFVTTSGVPFPSEGQAYRVVTEELTPEEYQELLGREKSIRPKRKYNLGNFTGQFICNLEAIESDGFVIHEVLRSFIDDRPTARLIVVRIICCTTSRVVGVGFSVGGEKKEAYSSAFYSMVADPSALERYYGLDEGTLEGFVVGALSGFSTTDRGPGAWLIVMDELDSRSPIRTTAPTEEPLSKAPVESSHPRHHDATEDKTFREADLTIAGAIKREFIRALRDNETSSIADRLTDAMKAEFIQLELPATPNGFWEYNRRKGNNAGDSDMGNDEGVRAFWTEITVKLCRDGVSHNGSSYGSDELIATGVLDRLGTAQEIELTAYALPCAIGYLKVDVDGELVEVERNRRVRADIQEYALTAAELEQSQRNSALLRSEQRMAAAVARVASDMQSVAQTGQAINGGRTRRGKKPSARKRSGEDKSAIAGHTRSSVA